MPLNNSNSSPMRKTFATREKSLPTYEEATEKIGQDSFVLPITPTFIENTQNVRTADTNNWNYQTNRAQILPRGQGGEPSLERPAMVHTRIYHVWNRGYPTLANGTDDRRARKQNMLGFHVVSYVIGMIILLVLILLFVKLAQTWLINNVDYGPHNTYTRI